MAAQTDLITDGIPGVVRDHGLRQVHPFPLVSDGKRPDGTVTSFRVPAVKAFGFPSIQIPRAGSALAALAFDCDQPTAARLALYDGDVPLPNWIVQRRSNQHLHVVYALDRPVHCYDAARPEPLRYASHVVEYYTQALSADPEYTAILTHNPTFGNHLQTEWGREEPYSLEELAEVIPLGWKAPKVCRNVMGRNCTLFDSLMTWAGRAENRSLDILPAAMIINQGFDFPLPVSEVEATARSVEKYRAGWEANGWHSKAFRGRQASRGRASGKARQEKATERLQAVIEYRAKGLTQRAIAERLGASVRTIKADCKKVQRTNTDKYGFPGVSDEQS
ncbi:MAG: replication initiation protein [Gammaproteobacteria bacterium]|nr:replication initiation protein [Gammaproteobacteria bacterium]